MDTVLLMILIVFGLAIASSTFRTPPPPQVIYVPVPSEPSSGGLGCLPWIVGFVILLVLLGVIRF